MESFRGPNGGIAFARPASTISLMDIVRAIEGLDLFEECIPGLPGYGRRKPCPLHEQWATARDRIRARFEHTSVADIGKEIKEQNLRISDIYVLDKQFPP